jgi:hypothetical protein
MMKASENWRRFRISALRTRSRILSRMMMKPYLQFSLFLPRTSDSPGSSSMTSSQKRPAKWPIVLSTIRLSMWSAL